MYERFTDNARQVMKLANQEAQRLNHAYIGTEHLLLGLVRREPCRGCDVLTRMEVSLDAVKRAVEKIVKPGPDIVTMGKLPQTPRAEKVIEHAIDEARAAGKNYVGSEHLLLGLVREGEGVAAQVLSRSFGLTLEGLRGTLAAMESKCVPESRRALSVTTPPVRCKVEIPTEVTEALRRPDRLPGTLVLELEFRPTLYIEFPTDERKPT